MNELQVFKYNTAEVRTVIINGEPWWVLKDVCDVLEIGNSRDVVVRLDDDEKGVDSIDTLGGKQKMTIINESGLYSVILRSDKPEAKNFRRWITHEVLPAIRKTGGYIPVDNADSDIEILAKAMMIANKTISEQEKRMGQLQTTNSQLAVDKQIMQPKADYFDELVDRNLLTSFRDTAKEFKVKERDFVTFLLEHKYIFRDKKGKLSPYASKNAGLFEVKECYNEKTNWSGVQTLITPKGRETFRLLLEGMKITRG
jgi:prophage antirepressor-like protein